MEDLFISVGIDLGTTNSLVSYFCDGEAIIIPNSLGAALTPSVVSLLENGEIVIGEAAKERLITYPDKTASLFKRNIGTKKEYKLGELKFLPQELSSFILKSLKDDAEKFTGKKVKEAIISVPAYFNNNQRKATIEAGRLAGIKVERLISEPTAAALAYGLQEKEEEIKFLVFDLGGGTFDISVIDLFDNVLEVRAVSGHNYLGGEDFNDILLEHFYQKAEIDKTSLDIKTIANLKKQSELAKITLTEKDVALMSAKINDKNVSLEISATEFEDLCIDLFSKLSTPLRQVLRDSGIKTDELDYVILVGGSTKMRIIRSFVTRIFKKFPLSTINPDEVVAKGAAIAAAMKERNKELKENVMTDVCPFTLGTNVVGESKYGSYSGDVFLPLIERNTTIPHSTVKTLANAYDNQEHILIKIYQGESSKASNNMLLGELDVPIERSAMGMALVDVRYTYDINGILEVEVTILKTGEVLRKVILSNGNAMSENEIEECLRKLKDIKIHPRENSVNRLLLEKAERLYQESLANTRAEISRMIIDFNAILDKQVKSEIDDYAKKFGLFLNSIEDMEI